MTENPFEFEVHHTNLDRKAYEIIKSMILGRQLKPGQKIVQQKLALTLGISRTPVTNALKLLEQEHLVQAIPRRGYYVSAFGAKEFIEIFEIREVLEGLAARRAATDPTDEQKATLRKFGATYTEALQAGDVHAYGETDRAFHTYVIEIGAMAFLQGILDSHNIIRSTYLVDTEEGLVRPPSATNDEHLAIIEAICEGRPEAAEAAMRRHLANSISFAREHIDELRIGPTPN